MQLPRRRLPEVIQDLDSSGHPFALVGGIAVGLRTEERHTKDVDFAIAVPDERTAKSFLRYLVAEKQYRPIEGFNDLRTDELRGASLFPPGPNGTVTPVDFLFTTCGVEREVVARAERVEFLPGLFVNVATRGDLIAMKVLSLDDARRPRDRADLAMLLKSASQADVLVADEAIELMEQRGYGKTLGKDDLHYELDQVVALYAPELEIDRGPTIDL